MKKEKTLFIIISFRKLTTRLQSYMLLKLNVKLIVRIMIKNSNSQENNEICLFVLNFLW